MGRFNRWHNGQFTATISSIHIQIDMLQLRFLALFYISRVNIYAVVSKLFDIFFLNHSFSPSLPKDMDCECVTRNSYMETSSNESEDLNLNFCTIKIWSLTIQTEFLKKSRIENEKMFQIQNERKSEIKMRKILQKCLV